MRTRFPSLLAWASWSKPWLRTIIAQGFSVDRAAVVAKARLPTLTAVYLAELAVESIEDLTTEKILSLAGIELANQKE